MLGHFWTARCLQVVCAAVRTVVDAWPDQKPCNTNKYSPGRYCYEPQFTIYQEIATRSSKI